MVRVKFDASYDFLALLGLGQQIRRKEELVYYDGKLVNAFEGTENWYEHCPITEKDDGRIGYESLIVNVGDIMNQRTNVEKFIGHSDRLFR